MKPTYESKDITRLKCLFLLRDKYNRNICGDLTYISSTLSFRSVAKEWFSLENNYAKVCLHYPSGDFVACRWKGFQNFENHAKNLPALWEYLGFVAWRNSNFTRRDWSGRGIYLHPAQGNEAAGSDSRLSPLFLQVSHSSTPRPWRSEYN